jgi:hypothetical protein
MRCLILVLLGVSGFLSAATADKSDALLIAPNVYKLAFENERVRVLSFVTEPGQKWPLHSPGQRCDFLKRVQRPQRHSRTGTHRAPQQTRRYSLDSCDRAYG